MCNNVIILFSLLLLFIKSGEHFRLFSSDAGTYKEARRFFTSPKSLINDHFDGNLALVTQTIHSQTFVFVMYYANFCGISRRMREPYEKAAAFYRERIPQGNSTIDKFHVKFIAIDCFYHDGACRKSYKLNYYPQMFLYVKGTRGYQYFGPAIAANLIEFIEKVRMPIIRLTNVEEFLDFTVQHESNILAQFDFSNDLHRYYYSLFVQAAFKHIEYDNEHPIRFAVILNQTIVDEISKLHNITLQKPFILSHRLDSTSIKLFPNITNNFTIDNLFTWVVQEYKKPFVGWIVPKNRYYSHSPSIDKATIADALTGHDNLLIFLTSNKPDELKLRQMYFYLTDCNITRSSLWLQRLEKLNNQSLINSKENLTNNEKHLLSSCCQYALNTISTSDIYDICVNNDRLPVLNLSESKAKRCLPVLQNLTLLKICYRSYCQRWLRSFTSIYQDKISDHHEITIQKRREKLYDQSTNIDDLLPPNPNSIEQYKGFLCRINSTWAFRLIDSRSYPSFGQNIGLVNNTKAIIVLQSKNEQHYVLNNHEISIENIYNLIDEISHNLRSRTLTTIPNDNTIIHHSNKLIELTTNSFHSIVFDSSKHVLVVYYTKWCGFCKSIWPVLFQTKKFFHQFTDLIFTRIQADKHDLPWHLTVFNYPSIILFPAERKNHSIVFPTSKESITSINLIKFLLYHLYMPNNVDEQWCKQTNNSFFSMLASTYVDFSQLSYLVQSYS